MLKCTSCNKFKQFSKFNVNSSIPRGYQYSCKDCLKIKQSKSKNKVSKEEAERLLSELDKQGKKYTCRNCEEEMTAGYFYYKRDRGNVYVNTTSCRQCTKDKQRMRSFGITPEKFEELLKLQDYKCGICGVDHDHYSSESQNNKVFSIDHDHGTGRIRGLLCCRCNRGLGYFKDSEDFLTKAISYLKGDDMV